MVILKQVFQDGPVTVAKIKGAVAVYIMIGFTWSYIYRLIDLQVPMAFNLPTSLTSPDEAKNSADLTYFSFVTLTTLGYGDITAAHPLSRMFVIIEALIGQLYPATLLARLVSLEIMNRESSREIKHKRVP
jgi:voltage-gated potassium channel Kch